MASMNKDYSQRITDLENLMKTRISEQRVNTAISHLESEVQSQLKTQNESLQVQIETSFAECKTTVDNVVIFADQRHNDVKREMKKVHDQAEQMAYIKDFTELTTNFVSLKGNLESDLDLI